MDIRDVIQSTHVHHNREWEICVIVTYLMLWKMYESHNLYG